MELTLDDLEHMGMEAIANNPSELIEHINKLGRNTVAQNKYISKIVTWLYKHKDDLQNNNDALNDFLTGWFDDNSIQTIKNVLNKTNNSKLKANMKQLINKGYKWISFDYYARNSDTNYTLIGFNEAVSLLWDLNDKQEAFEELNN